ncbi:response regulator [Leptospira ilyithenensis]|uniref:Phosphate regulon transcriptional regulatory protein PhoB n=1 Tax=Leptospira ilyithenensis TaxID=2484901 RepID=A0A4R9LQ84_9LEPT|nr:response regulator transcription factor [Leptospira ilyithenensis]TGN10185.1 DNA-binding response regulator [Leptospira ilyithenensis]
MKILVVDDEEDIAGLIQFHLEEEGFQVEVCHNGMEVLPRLEKNLPEGIILDLMLPGIGGMDLCKRIKEKYPQIPIIMVTAKTGETDVVLGLELGADDYIRKPFNIRELIARVRTVTRRQADGATTENVGTVSTGKIQINPTAHKVYVDGKEIDLTLIEFKILQLFASNTGVAFSRDKLLDRIWGKDVFVTDRTVDVNIKRLRDKLLSEKERLETIRGVGYRFRDA